MSSVINPQTTIPSLEVSSWHIYSHPPPKKYICPSSIANNIKYPTDSKSTIFSKEITLIINYSNIKIHSNKLKKEVGSAYTITTKDQDGKISPILLITTITTILQLKKPSSQEWEVTSHISTTWCIHLNYHLSNLKMKRRKPTNKSSTTS